MPQHLCNKKNKCTAGVFPYRGIVFTCSNKHTDKSIKSLPCCCLFLLTTHGIFRIFLHKYLCSWTIAMGIGGRMRWTATWHVWRSSTSYVVVSCLHTITHLFTNQTRGWEKAISHIIPEYLYESSWFVDQHTKYTIQVRPVPWSLHFSHRTVIEQYLVGI